MDERLKLPHFDPDYCRKVARWSASTCVAVLVIEVLFLVIVDPNAGRCRGWIGEESPATSLWVTVGTVTAPLMAWMCYVALHWDQKFSQILYDSIANGSFEQILFLDANKLFLQVSIFWCLACALPLWLMLFGCTS